MDDKVVLAEKLALLDAPYSPASSATSTTTSSGRQGQGRVVWQHDDTDDFFLVLRGRLTIHLRDRDVELEQGELFVVPRGVEHRPRATEATHVLLIEPSDTPNTGDAGGERTAAEREI